MPNTTQRVEGVAGSDDIVIASEYEAYQYFMISSLKICHYVYVKQLFPTLS